MKQFVISASFIWFAAISWFSHAAESDEHLDALKINPALNLSGVLEQALAKNPQQNQLKAEAYAVEARQSMAQSLLPNAPAISVFHQNDILGSGRNERDFQAFVELPIWMPGQRLNRTKVAELSFKDLESNQQAVKLKVAGLLRDAVWDVTMNGKQVSLAQARIKMADALVADVEKKFKAGELAKTDLMLVQNDKLSAERQLVMAEAELMHARHRYTLLTGLQEMPAQIEESLSNREDFEQSPIWLAALSKVSLAESQRDLVSAERRENPSVVINARTSQGAFDTQYNQSMGVTVRIPLDHPGRAAPMQIQAEQQIGAAMTDRETLRLAMMADLHEAEHNLKTTQAELTLASQQLTIAREHARLAHKAFSLGETDVTSLLRIQNQTFEVENAVAIRQTQYQWNIARYNQAVGVLP